ncbi:MAG TPA: 30S ribosomal protein S2 [Rhizobiales bacterium]|nr:30S ribosomal protein S2 [bacterium BMS3Bbin10]HDO51336.1 30S ribosomal protein S2 [Hyphomicrobiales bacterium]
MALPTFNMRQLLEAGVHFGHQTHRWNPKMGPYIFGSRNKIHIIDLAQTVPLLHQALVTVSDTIAKGGRLLFVGTKRQASDAIAEGAKQCAQYYINHRWLGGTLTNWQTISKSIKRLRQLDELLEGESQGLTKKELLQLTREREKIERALGGIKDIGGLPNLLFVIDTNKEAIAIAEARKLNIPVIAIVDTNCNPDPITFPIPGNDDAARAITLYCDLISRAAIDGIERAQGASGIDIGSAADPAAEAALTDDGEPAPKPKKQDAEKEAKGKDDGKPASGGDEKEADKADAAKEPATDKKEAKKQDETPAKITGGFEKLEKPDGEADDLKELTGVGPVLEKTLNEFGIFHYRQIAALEKADIAEIDEALNFKGRIERDDWIKQSKELAKKSD